MNNLIVFLNDTADLKRDAYYLFDCLHTHYETKNELNKLCEKNKKKSNRIILTTDISVLSYDLMEKKTYNCNIFIVCFFNKNTGDIFKEYDDKYSSKCVDMRVLCLAKNNQIIQNTNKELRIGHKLLTLILGGHFNAALKNSTYKLPKQMIEGNVLLDKIYCLYGNNS